MKQIIENIFIDKLSALFSRSPYQQNKTQESDAEIIVIPGIDYILALTTDSIVEEIERGLYSDPYLIGWMTVIANLSDLAAVGAQPIGVLINETFRENLSSEYIESIQTGIHDACEEHQVHVLGGDTSFSSHLQMSASAFGIIKDGPAIKRIGCMEEDLLFSSGKLGIGSVYAINHFLNISTGNEDLFKPYARVKEGQLLQRYAGCCIDTSDGFIPAIDQLMRLNNKGFILETETIDILCPQCLDICIKTKLDPWMILAGPHGEFELVFTITSASVDDFLMEADTLSWEPVFLGKTIPKVHFKIKNNNRLIKIDTAEIRNLFNNVNGNVEKYIEELQSFNY